MLNDKHHTRSGTLWGARFKDLPEKSLTDISRSPDSYFRLLPQDIAGSKAHTFELGRESLLTEEEVKQVNNALDEIEKDWTNGLLERDPESEDVHGFLEQELIKRVGHVGGKIRAGRSRNDQTANDLKLFMRQEARFIHQQCRQLIEALIDQGEQHAGSLCLGFTHLQAAQPITFGHQLLSHAQALSRDLRRLATWDIENAISPLGAAALAGSGITSHPELMANDLGYTSSYNNSIDAVANRDHVAEFIFTLSQMMVTISRLSEEQILWASPQFGWIKLHDSYSTGSSIMPQKKNPDIAELSRGKSGTMLGLLTGFMATQKSLPTAYNRDLFEDKNAVIQAVDIMHLVLPAMSGSVKSMKINEAKMAEQATWGHSLATDIADMLSKEGVSFRDAHEIVGEIVSYCDEKGIQLYELEENDLKKLDSRINMKMIASINGPQSVENRLGKGSSKPSLVLEQAIELRKHIHSPKMLMASLNGNALSI
ncbi:argininosuccinate lyase [Halomonas sp. NPDC076908]|uniref:argininosuccinate lyase n=1 Tax=Halomonas sp. NPDC076908 TaxID=3390567 RepID=UPI003CFC59B1